MSDPKIVTFTLHCSECNERTDIDIESGVFSEVACWNCGAQFDVSLTVELRTPVETA